MVVELPDDPRAAGVARDASREALNRWALCPLRDAVVLVVSELVGNAVKYGRPPFLLMLRRSGERVRVEVHDAAADELGGLQNPFQGPPSWDAEGGRGLSIVEALADKHGVDQVPFDGKRVWAVFTAHP